MAGIAPTFHQGWNAIVLMGTSGRLTFRGGAPSRTDAREGDLPYNDACDGIGSR